MTEGHIVPPFSRTFWYHKDPDSRIPQSFLDNVIDFSRKNPAQDVAFITDDPERIINMLPEDRPSNLHIDESRAHLASEDFPKSQKFADAMVKKCPAFSKDIRSYISLRQQPGISFDPDTKWHAPIPLPLRIKGNASVHKGYENSVIAYAGDSKDLMGQVLQSSEEQIPKSYKIVERPGATIWFRQGNGNICMEALVDEIQFSAYMKIMRANSVDALEKYVSYTTPASSFNHEERNSCPTILKLNEDH